MTRKEYNKSVDLFSDNIYRFLLKSSRNKVLSEDIVQESFLTLWEHVNEIAFEKAKAFLFTTAYRKMVDVFRREKKNADIENISYQELELSSANYDLQEMLEVALERLNPIQKNLILLRDYENYSYDEIAHITGLSESQVKVYIFRGRKHLKEFIRSIETIL